jgi:hypothetical protein
MIVNYLKSIVEKLKIMVNFSFSISYILENLDDFTYDELFEIIENFKQKLFENEVQGYLNQKSLTREDLE